MQRGHRNPGKTPAVLLAVAVHLALALFLIFGVRWQNQHPETMMVELVPPPPPVKLPPPKLDPRVEPKPDPKPDPKPEPRPEPPPATPSKAQPKPQPPPNLKADIALKQKQEKDRLVREKLEAELQEMQEKQDKARRDQDRLVHEQREQREQREREMREIAKKESDRREREMKDLLKRETDKRSLEEMKLAQERAQAEAEARKRRDEQLRVEREQREQRDRAAAAEAALKSAASKSAADYVNRIQAKIKGNVILPPEVNGNPEAVFEVVQLPTGEIISADLRKSSGSRIYDDAVSRAIIKSSPLPKPDSPDQFQRTLTLRFRPQS